MAESRPPWDKVGIHGLHRQREWDTVQTVSESEFGGDELVFVRLEDGETVIERDDPPGRLRAGGELDFVKAVRRDLEPPFRVHAVRSSTGWAVAAKGIETAELPIEGEELTFTSAAGTRSLEVDGRPSLAGYHALERLAGGRFSEYVIQARRLTDSVWEVQLAAL